MLKHLSIREKKIKMQDTVEVLASLFLRNRPQSDLLAAALQPKEHPAHEEEKPARRLRNGVGTEIRRRNICRLQTTLEYRTVIKELRIRQFTRLSKESEIVDSDKLTSEDTVTIVILYKCYPNTWHWHITK